MIWDEAVVADSRKYGGFYFGRSMERYNKPPRISE